MTEPTQAQVSSACLSFRHDYGLLSEAEQKAVQFEAREWLYAWRKEGLGFAQSPGLSIDTIADIIIREMFAPHELPLDEELTGKYQAIAAKIVAAQQPGVFLPLSLVKKLRDHLEQEDSFLWLDEIRMIDAALAPQSALEPSDESLLRTNLIVCLGILRDAASPFVPSSGRDNEWLACRDHVVKNADRALAAFGENK